MSELQKYKEQQLAVKIHNMNVLNLSKDEILKSFDKDELNIIKSQFGKMLDVIEKGKPATIGEIHTWNGKKFKKQPNGKWLEVSERVLPVKKGPNGFQVKFKDGSAYHSFVDESKDDFIKRIENKGYKLAKEHTDEEVGLVTQKTDKEILDIIPILERQNISGYKDWQELKEASKDNKNLDEATIQAYRKYKENALKKYKQKED